jgi:hypothetical protein
MFRTRRRLGAVVLIGAAILSACSGGTDGGTATGVVIDLEGDLTTVSSFVLRLPDGSDRTIVPAPGIRFHGDAAIGHLRDHLRSGAPVRIEYEVLDDGSWVARLVEDASGPSE